VSWASTKVEAVTMLSAEGVGDVVDAVVRDGGRVRFMLLRVRENETFGG
jgi:hypothetical protein